MVWANAQIDLLKNKALQSSLKGKLTWLPKRRGGFRSSQMRRQECEGWREGDLLTCPPRASHAHLGPHTGWEPRTIWRPPSVTKNFHVHMFYYHAKYNRSKIIFLTKTKCRQYFYLVSLLPVSFSSTFQLSQYIFNFHKIFFPQVLSLLSIL